MLIEMHPSNPLSPTTSVWVNTLFDLLDTGKESAPRGKKIKEILGYTTTIDMNEPIVDIPGRKLGYKFMAAEAAWILSGDNKVSNIGPYARHISSFSDDGLFFNGAYGPEVVSQLTFVCNKLIEDNDTRQAIMTIWKKNPPASKDIPCTISVQWFIRDGELHCIDHMRSSDIWLGWPYDIFNFSMLSWYIKLILKERGLDVKIGSLTLIANSQHIYETNWEEAENLNYSELAQYQPTLIQPAVDKLNSPHDLITMLWNMADGSGALSGFRQFQVEDENENSSN